MIGNHIYSILNDSTDLVNALTGGIWPVEIPLPEDSQQVFPALAYSVDAIVQAQQKFDETSLWVDNVGVEFQLYSLDYANIANISYLLRKHLNERTYQCDQFKVGRMTFQGYSEVWDEGLRAYVATISYQFNTRWIHI